MHYSLISILLTVTLAAKSQNGHAKTNLVRKSFDANVDLGVNLNRLEVLNQADPLPTKTLSNDQPNYNAAHVFGEKSSRGGRLLIPVGSKDLDTGNITSKFVADGERSARGGILVKAVPVSEDVTGLSTLIPDGERSSRGGILLKSISDATSAPGSVSGSARVEETPSDKTTLLIPDGEKSSRGGTLLKSVAAITDGESYSSLPLSETSTTLVPAGPRSQRGGTLLTSVPIPVNITSTTSVTSTGNSVGLNTVSDTEILNFALSLEYLEASFYSEALKRFSTSSFAQGGFSSSIRKKLENIKKIGDEHVEFLKGILGDDAIQPCTYNFDLKTVGRVMTLNRIFTGVGVSTYITSAALLDTRSYIRAATSILSVAARQSSWASKVLTGQTFPNAFDTSISLAGIASVAKNFITECPADYATKLGNILQSSHAWKSLSIKGEIVSGEKIKMQFDQEEGVQYWAAWFHEYDVEFTKIDANGITFIPNLTGQIYVAVTKTKVHEVRDADVFAGLAVVDL